MRFGGFGSVIYSNLTSNRSKCSLFWQKCKSQEAIWNPDEPALNDLAPGKRVWELLFLFQGNWFCCRWKHKTRHFSCTQRFVQITVRATRNAVLALYVSAKPRICWKWHFNSALCQRWAKGRVRVRKWSCFVTTDSGLGKRPDVLIKMSSFVCMKAAAKYHNHQWNNRTFDGWDGRWMVVSKWSQLVSNVRFRLTQEADLWSQTTLFSDNCHNTSLLHPPPSETYHGFLSSECVKEPLRGRECYSLHSRKEN